MIQVEVNKINHVEHIRMYSDRNFYLKVVGSDELLTEVMTLGKKPIDVIETDIPIKTTEPSRQRPYRNNGGLEAKLDALMIIASKQVDDIPLSEDEKEEVGRWFELAPEEPPGKEPPDEEPPFGEIGRG